MASPNHSPRRTKLQFTGGTNHSPWRAPTTVGSAPSFSSRGQQSQSAVSTNHSRQRTKLQFTGAPISRQTAVPLSRRHTTNYTVPITHRSEPGEQWHEDQTRYKVAAGTSGAPLSPRKTVKTVRVSHGHYFHICMEARWKVIKCFFLAESLFCSGKNSSCTAPDGR